MKAAVVQLNSQADVAANLARAGVLVEQAVDDGATFVALPENFAFMGEETDKREIQERLLGDGPILTALKRWALSRKVYVLGGGFPERGEDPSRPFNTSVLVGPQGDVVAAYRKIHLFDVTLPDGTKYQESDGVTAGADVVTSDVGGLRVGLSVCYDLRFPELFRRMASVGVHVITVPAAFTLLTGKDHRHVLLRARAIENQAFVIAPAQGGKHPKGRQTYGKSVVIDPWGDVLAQCGEGEGWAAARLDPAYMAKVRRDLPCLHHRRL